MKDDSKTGPSPVRGLDRPALAGPALAQRALSCELTGDLERAVALIRRLRASPPDAASRSSPPAAPRSQPADRRIA